MVYGLQQEMMTMSSEVNPSGDIPVGNISL